MNIGDVYEKSEIYFIVTEICNGVVTKSIPLSRWILQNYVGSTQTALDMFKAVTEDVYNRKHLTEEQLFDKIYDNIQAHGTGDKLRVKCLCCEHEFDYVPVHLAELAPNYEHGEDLWIQCTDCDNWEQVGNKVPQSFEILGPEIENQEGK